MGNIVGSFFSSFAGSGSFTRTAVCSERRENAHGRDILGLWTALTILLFAPVANYIPKASLAGLLIVIAYTMVDKRRLIVTWKSSNQSRLVLFGTLVSTLILPLEYAVFVGVFLSIVLLLVTGQTDLTQLVPRQDSGYDELPFNQAPESEGHSKHGRRSLFRAAEDLDYELLECLTPKTPGYSPHEAPAGGGKHSDGYSGKVRRHSQNTGCPTRRLWYRGWIEKDHDRLRAPKANRRTESVLRRQ